MSDTSPDPKPLTDVSEIEKRQAELLEGMSGDPPRFITRMQAIQTYQDCATLLTTITTLRASLGEAVCTGCGSNETIEEIRKTHPGSLSCCPERDMKPAKYWYDRATKAEASLGEAEKRADRAESQLQAINHVYVQEHERLAASSRREAVLQGQLAAVVDKLRSLLWVPFANSGMTSAEATKAADDKIAELLEATTPATLNTAKEPFGVDQFEEVYRAVSEQAPATRTLGRTPE